MILSVEAISSFHSRSQDQSAWQIVPYTLIVFEKTVLHYGVQKAGNSGWWRRSIGIDGPMKRNGRIAL
jgi:hypothetical protein